MPLSKHCYHVHPMAQFWVEINCFWLKTVIIFAITFGVTSGKVTLFTFMVTYKVTCLPVTSYCSTSRVTLYTSSPAGMMCFCRPNLERVSILALSWSQFGWMGFWLNDWSGEHKPKILSCFILWPLSVFNAVACLDKGGC